MGGENLTVSRDFLIVGFTDLHELKVPLFVLFLLLYVLTIVGNLLILAIIYTNSKMHTPMYFFLTNLSFLDITYTSLIFPKMLAYFFEQGVHVSLTECLLQVHFFMAMVCTESLLLTVMAYDRYVAICNSFHYMTTTSKAVCLQLAAGSWIVGLIDIIPHTLELPHICYCEPHIINHFFCDLAALMKLSCSSTRTIEALTCVVGLLIGMVPCILIITSYMHIISSILKIHSAEGRHKAFSTCASHLTVVILFYGSVCSTYMRPTSTFSMKDSKVMSWSYIAITPLCNPIIYSLKNTEFKNAMWKAKMIAYKSVKCFNCGKQIQLKLLSKYKLLQIIMFT